jgi:hypothetical protein
MFREVRKWGDLLGTYCPRRQKFVFDFHINPLIQLDILSREAEL